MSTIRIALDRSEKLVKSYEAQPIETGKIVFYGSSGFTRWSKAYDHRPMEEDLLGHDGKKAVINHGFGGSTVEEQLYYCPRLIIPWQPKAMVFGGLINDHYYGYDKNETQFLFERMIEYIRLGVPGIRFFLCDIHPTAKHLGEKEGSWVHWRDEMNAFVEDYCAHHDDCTFIRHCVSPVFYADPADVGSYDTVRADLFIQDKVHFTQEGYDLYGQFFREALKDIL